MKVSRNPPIETLLPKSSCNFLNSAEKASTYLVSAFSRISQMCFFPCRAETLKPLWNTTITIQCPHIWIFPSKRKSLSFHGRFHIAGRQNDSIAMTKNSVKDCRWNTRSLKPVDRDYWKWYINIEYYQRLSRCFKKFKLRFRLQVRCLNGLD